MSAKTMRRIVLVGILFIVLAAAACGALYMFSSGTALESARTQVLNTVIDRAGIKARIETELRDRGSALAEEYGIPQQIIDSAIDTLDVPNWEIVNTPDSSSENDRYGFDVADSQVQITTYDDPAVISVKSDGKVNTFGQSISFKVPESAQAYTDLLPIIGAVDEAGLLEALEMAE